MITTIPFTPNVRLNGEEVQTELYNEIKRFAEYYNLDEKDFEGIFKLEYHDTDITKGWFFISEIIYTKGDLNEMKKKGDEFTE